MLINSVHNETIKQFAKLKSVKGRHEQKAFLVEGSRCVVEALSSDINISQLIVLETKTEDYVEILNNYHGQLLIVSQKVMDKICDTQAPQGIAAIVSKCSSTESEIGDKILALDGISDPGNMGTLLRTAWAFGVKTVWLSSDCTDPYSPKCVRSGMGAHFHLNIKELPSLPDVLSKMDEYEIIGAHLKGTESLSITSTSKKSICVVGSEATGLSEPVKKCCSQLFRIPMVGGAESLNVSVAAGILLYRAWVMPCI